MKHIYLIKTGLVLLVCISTLTVINAQSISQIDINKFTDSRPRNIEYSAKNAYAYLNGYSYLTADDGIHGRELWKTDGTTANTQLVKDVNPGAASSNYDYTSDDIKVSGGKIFFAADGGPGYQGLWVSDGTNEGTQFVADVTGHGAMPSYLTDVNGILFFAISYYDSYYFQNVNQLWESDGTSAGTFMVADLGSYGYNLRQLRNVNGRLFFTFYSYYTGIELYTSDGTSWGTNMVTDINPYGDSNPLQLTPSNGLLYFIANDGYGSKLWVSDGTSFGTYAVSNDSVTCYATSDDYNTDTFAIVNNALYFQGYTVANGNELYKYDESNPGAGLTLVKDVEPGPNSSFPSLMTNVDGTLFFIVGPAGQDAELWKSDGTKAGTKLVKDINPGGNNFYYGLTDLNGQLVFAFSNNASGFDLWKSNGTAGGTKILKDINPGVYSSFPQFMTASNGLLLFGANDGVNGYELWKSDGTAHGTSMIKDINQTASSSSNPYGFIAGPNNKVLFGAYDDIHGNELWSSDGTVSGTVLTKDIHKGFFDASPSYFINFKNNTYFFASDSSGFRLWKSDGTEGGTEQIPAAWDYVNSSLVNMLAGENLFYVIDYNSNNSVYEIWRSDGTTAGTYLVKSDVPSYYSINAVVVGDVLYFTSDDFSGNYGVELYKSDGTVENTGIVKDIYAGPGGSYPSQLFNFNGKLYFSADYGYGPFLWTSDGTDAGTMVVKSLYVDNVAFAEAKGKLFFSGMNAVAKGHELYATDGTPSGTKIVKDIVPGPLSSTIYQLVSGDTALYFTADDGKHGAELWVSNGAKEGTHLVKNITPGINSTNLVSLVNAQDKLFFVVNDTLWQSDGTKEGTHKIKDANLKGVSNIVNLASIGDRLYFSAYDHSIGQELFTMAVSSNFASSKTNDVLAVTKVNDAFEAKLLTNPINDQLKLSVYAKTPRSIQIIITDVSGRTVRAEKQILSAGTNVFSYNTSAWAGGIYVIQIAAGDGSYSLLKAMK